MPLRYPHRGYREGGDTVPPRCPHGGGVLRWHSVGELTPCPPPLPPPGGKSAPQDEVDEIEVYGSEAQSGTQLATFSFEVCPLIVPSSSPSR